MKRTTLPAMLTLAAVLASTVGGGGLRRQIGWLEHEVLDERRPHDDADDHDDDAQAQVQTGVLAAALIAHGSAAS